MKIHRPLTAAALVLASALAAAQTPPTATPGVDARQAKQEQRIEQGVASGTLTARETRRLEREQTRIAKAETQAKADGTVTAKERRHLHKAQDAASRDIKHQKHDAQTAVPKAGG
jgi:hypothetical protein